MAATLTSDPKANAVSLSVWLWFQAPRYGGGQQWLLGLVLVFQRPRAEQTAACLSGSGLSQRGSRGATDGTGFARTCPNGPFERPGSGCIDLFSRGYKRYGEGGGIDLSF